MTSKPLSRCLLPLLLICGVAGTAVADGALGVYDSRSLSFIIVLVLATPFLLVAGALYLLIKPTKQPGSKPSGHEPK